MSKPLIDEMSHESMAHPDSNYKVLALETRPQTLSALVGQETVQKVLHDLISKNRVPHALLFTGTRGTGKTSTARIFAKALCCELGPTSEPCGRCVHCQGITNSSHEDVLEIDGASNTGVDQIRELRESARFFPKSARYKIFIIDEVHMLSIGAFNALLKTLEEPPPKVVFILATTEVTKVPTTVRSRCMVLPFKRVEVGVLANHLEKVLLKRNIKANKEALLSVAREARGSFRDGLSLLEQAIPFAEDGILSKKSIDEAFGIQDRDYAKSLFKSIVTSDTSQGLGVLHEADRSGLDFSRVLQQAAEYFRHAIVLKALQSSPSAGAMPLKALSPLAAAPTTSATPTLMGNSLVEELLESERAEVLELTQSVSSAALTECFRTLQQGMQDLSKATTQRPWAEIAFLQAIEHAKWLDTEALLRLVSSHSNAQLPAAKVSQEIRLPHKTQSDLISGGKSQGALPSHPLNFAKLKEWISHVAERSVPLGAKLRHAHFETFNETEAKLAIREENKLYGSVSHSDIEIMKHALERIGFGRALLIGFHGEGNEAPRGQASTQDSLNAGADQKKKEIPHPVKRFSAQATDTQTSNKIDGARAAQPMPSFNKAQIISSVSQLENTQAQNEFERRKEKLLAHPFFVKLTAEADRVEIHPAKGD